MTKRFALPDTLPYPYFTIDAGATATLTVKVCRIDGDRMAVEVWRDQTILSRLFAKRVQVAGATLPNNDPARKTDR